ncbi:MAG: aminotransferase class I/II-fold pyridoxal phosphate-dependent enzyme [Candidatus Eisenbacteria bacterium]|nr:aminotransferase class I/II-fold pyridoxal phosphate-dependent enzyme [Candidatus Eisenbacteria bacterium]
MLTKRMAHVKPSVTLAVSAKAKELTAQGIEITDFSVGEPDFRTPTHIKEAAIRAIEENFTRYTVNTGIPELRAAICEKLSRDNDLSYEPTEIIVSSGAKQCLYSAIMAMVAPGDEVLVPTPCWVSYLPQVALAGAKAVPVTTDEETNFRVTPASLEAKISDRTRAIILNSPSNPTGAAYSAGQLRAIASVLRKHGIFVIADEIYEKLVYNGFQFVSFGSLDDGWKERCLVVNGVSKAYAMTGWRIGYAAGPASLIKAMAKIQGHSTSNANSIAQKAALAALTGPQDGVEQMRQAFSRRRDLMLEHLAAIPELRTTRPQGAFYLFPNWSAYIGRSAGGKKIESCVDLATYLLEEARVAAVPGAGFEAPGYLRFSYAASEEQISAGMERVAKAAAALH